jgi:hypothetical protein
MIRKVRLLGLLLALVLGASALQATLIPPPQCEPGVGICKICGCGERCPVCPICCFGN